MSTARCYLDPARKRSNLTIETRALAQSLTFDGLRCTGVRYKVGERLHEAHAGVDLGVLVDERAGCHVFLGHARCEPEHPHDLWIKR